MYRLADTVLVAHPPTIRRFPGFVRFNGQHHVLPSTKCLLAHRASGGHRHYRGADRIIVASCSSSPRSCPTWPSCRSSAVARCSTIESRDFAVVEWKQRVESARGGSICCSTRSYVGNLVAKGRLLFPRALQSPCNSAFPPVSEEKRWTSVDSRIGPAVLVGSCHISRAPAELI